VAGRMFIARLYWFELAFYAVLAWVLIVYFGIVGAAAAWSIRVILDAVIMISFVQEDRTYKIQVFFSFLASYSSLAGLLKLSQLR
jgi:O-antigen/teichoic acid export membrane protein